MTTSASTRELARDLIAEGLSNREIGRRLGVGKDTVRRWRTQLADPAHGGAPAARDVASARATPAEPAPPGADQLTVVLTDDIREHLAVLATGGLTTQDAIACSLQFIADAVRGAWDYDICPRGLLPTIRPRTSHPAATPTGDCP